MQKQKISLKRVAAGVLVGFVAITSFAGVGRAMQASVFSDLVAWVSGGPVAQMDCSPDGWWVDDGYGGGWCEYGNAGGDPYMDPNYNDPYVDPYSGGSDCSPDGWWDPNMQACQYGSPDPYYNDAGNWQDCGVNSWWDNVTQSCQTMDYSGSSCGYDQWWDNVTQSCQIMDYSWTSCGYDEYWDSYSQSCMPNGSSSGSSCASNEWWDSGNQMCQSNDYSQSSCGEGYWERCDDSGCWCESDYDSEGCYYDHTGAYICDGYGYNGGGQNCYYDQLNNWICEPGDDDYYGSNYDGYCDPDSDDDPDCYNFNDVPYCGDACYSECDDTGACWCECDADDQYSGNCYYDQNNEYICEDWGYYEGDDNMMWEDDWDDWGDDYFMDPQAWCDSTDYYWADNWGPDCFCEYGDSYFPDPNDYTKCVDHSQYGYQSCMDKGMMYNPDRKSCEENFYQHGDYDWSKQSDKSLDWGNVWQGYEEDEKDYWSQDDKWVKDEKRNMENMITESNWWAKDVKNSKEEGENWLSEIEWRCDQWGADYENMSSKGKLTSSGQDLYEDAISFCSKAKSKVNNLLGKFDDLEDDAKQAKQDMEDAYDDFVNGDEKNSEEFWDAQKGGAVNEWRDVYRSQIETWGRLLNFYDFKLEVKRIERETGASAHELGDEITEAVSFADYALSEVQDMLSTELPALITEAKSCIADGLDPWRAIDTVRDFFNDTRDILDEDRFMWDALDMSWGHANDMKMQNFMAKELEFITEELENASKEIEEMKAQGIDVTRFEGLLEEAQDILDQLEETDDEREMEDLFGRLDQIGREADMEGKKLGVAFGQHDKRGIYIETMSASVTDADAFANMLYDLSTSNEDVMNKLIEILLEKITSSELDKFVEYSGKFGNIGILDSVSVGYADADKYDDLMSAKLAVLEELDSKISILEKKIGGMEAKLQEITTKVAEYNWYGDAAEEISKILADMEDELDDADTEAERDAVYAKYDSKLEDSKEDARKSKFDDGLIPFVDTDDDQWYTGYVWEVMNSGLVNGYKDASGNLTGYYGPGDNVTVAETLKIALENAGVGEGNDSTSKTGIQDHWSSNYFGAAEDLGMTFGESGYQDPNQYATRGEVLQAGFEALGINIPDVANTDFGDVSGNHENADAIQYAKELGIVSGDDGTGDFRPDDSINRAEVAKVFDNMLDLIDAGEL